MKVLTRELDFTDAGSPHSEALSFIERGSVDCTRCLPSVHPIVSHSSGEVEGGLYTVVRFKCAGRQVAQVFDDHGDDLIDGDEDGLS